MGRKPVPKNLKRDQRLTILLTRSELERYESASQQANAESVSAWVRAALEKEASECESQG